MNFKNIVNVFKEIEIYWVIFLLIFWIKPDVITSWSPESVKTISSLFMLEFIFGHAGVAFASTTIFKTNRSRILALILFSFWYAPFFIVLAFYGFSIVSVMFFVSLVERVYKSSQVQKKSSNGKDFLSIEFIDAIVRIFSLMLMAIPPMFDWPKLGVTDENLQLSGSGHFVDHPEKMLIWFIFFYLSQLIYKQMKPRIFKKRYRR